MSVEGDLEEYARRMTSLINEEKAATHDEARERSKNIRNVLLMDGEGLMARSPEALKAKAKMIWNEDWIQNPTTAGTSFVRSLLRDLLHWEP